MNILSILIGVLSLPFIILAFIPFLAWSLWILLLMPLFGALVGQLSSSRTGRNFNLIILAVGALRLFLGGGWM